MPIPDFILALRAKIGHDPLWLTGVTAVVTRQTSDQRTEVLLVRRSDNGHWTPVTGIIDPGEDAHVAALRELREEASVVAEIDRLVWLAVTDQITYSNGDVTQYLDHTFACSWVSGEPALGDDENTDVGFFDVEALPELSAWHSERITYVLTGNREVRLGRLPCPPRTP